MHPHWYMMTAVMPLCFAICVTLATLQTKSLQWSLQSNKNAGLSPPKREIFCLYGQYIIGGMCAVQCFLCHVSNLFPDFYCIYGMSVCVITYAATKSCLYGFFLERSRCIQDVAPILPSYVWTYVFPAYIVSYFAVYLVLCPLTFRGAVVDPTVDSTIPTACLFGEYHAWVFDLSAAVDLLNCVLFLFLFIWPIYKLDQKQEAENLQNVNFEVKSVTQGHLTFDLREVFKWNIGCSTICSISSITFLFVMSFAKHGPIGYYLWLGGNLDIMINSICLFLMLGTNRRYLKHIYAKIVGASEDVASKNGSIRQAATSQPVPIIVATSSASVPKTPASVDIQMMEKGLQMDDGIQGKENAVEEQP